MALSGRNPVVHGSGAAPDTGSAALTSPRPPAPPDTGRHLEPPPPVVVPPDVELPAWAGLAMEWRGHGQALTVGGYRLASPCTYTSAAVPGDDEASCIARDLAVDTPAENDPASVIVPRYSKLTPAQRGTYLEWLAGGRATPAADQRYVLLFFYGLERRALLDGRDLHPILDEVWRLLTAQPLSRLWQGRFSRFVAYVVARAGLAAFDDAWLGGLLDALAINEEPATEALEVQRLASRGQPLSPEQARRVIVCVQQPRDQPSPVTMLAAELFDRRYPRTFGPGVLLAPLTAARPLTYHPASWTLARQFGPQRLAAVDVPDLRALPTSWAPLLALWNDCLHDADIALRSLPGGPPAPGSVSPADVWFGRPSQAPAESDLPPAPERPALVTEADLLGVAAATGQAADNAVSAMPVDVGTPTSLSSPAAETRPVADLSGEAKREPGLSINLQGKLAVPLAEEVTGRAPSRWALFHHGARVAMLNQPTTAERLVGLGYQPVDTQHRAVVLAALGEVHLSASGPALTTPRQSAGRTEERDAAPAPLPDVTGTTGRGAPGPAGPASAPAGPVPAPPRARPEPDLDARELAARIVAETHRNLERRDDSTSVDR